MKQVEKDYKAERSHGIAGVALHCICSIWVLRGAAVVGYVVDLSSKTDHLASDSSDSSQLSNKFLADMS